MVAVAGERGGEGTKRRPDGGTNIYRDQFPRTGSPL